jgi:hypothetical protein
MDTFPSIAYTARAALQDSSISAASKASVRQRLQPAGKIQATSLLISVVFASPSPDQLSSSCQPRQQHATSTTCLHDPTAAQAADFGHAATESAGGVGDHEGRAYPPLAVACAVQELVQELQHMGTLDADFAWPLIRVLCSKNISDDSALAAAELLSTAAATAGHIRAVHKHLVAQPCWLQGLPLDVGRAVVLFLERHTDGGALNATAMLICLFIAPCPDTASNHVPGESRC